MMMIAIPECNGRIKCSWTKQPTFPFYSDVLREIQRRNPQHTWSHYTECFVLLHLIGKKKQQLWQPKNNQGCENSSNKSCICLRQKHVKRWQSGGAPVGIKFQESINLPTLCKHRRTDTQARIHLTSTLMTPKITRMKTRESDKVGGWGKGREGDCVVWWFQVILSMSSGEHRWPGTEGK